MRTLMVAAAMMTASAAVAQGFDPRQHREFAGPATQMLVLATPHLSNMPKTFRRRA